MQNNQSLYKWRNQSTLYKIDVKILQFSPTLVMTFSKSAKQNSCDRKHP